VDGIVVEKPPKTEDFINIFELFATKNQMG
jgi:hypothetical protein